MEHWNMCEVNGLNWIEELAKESNLRPDRLLCDDLTSYPYHVQMSMFSLYRVLQPYK